MELLFFRPNCKGRGFRNQRFKVRIWAWALGHEILRNFTRENLEVRLRLKILEIQCLRPEFDKAMLKSTAGSHKFYLTCLGVLGSTIVIV